jgi:hypothetical protein
MGWACFSGREQKPSDTGSGKPPQRHTCAKPYSGRELIKTQSRPASQMCMTTAGKKTVTVTFQGVTATFEIYVHNGGLQVVDSSLYPQSNHDYSYNLSETKTFTYTGATSLKITFNSSTSVESNYDYIYIYDGTGIQIAKYTGTEAANKTLTISGDTFSVKLTSDSSRVKYGYAFSKIEANMGMQHPAVTVPG